MTVVPLQSKQEADVAAGILESLTKMKGNPKFIYTDDEGSFSSNAVKDILAKKKIEHIITRNHAPVAERAIRTFKDMLYKRIDDDIKKGKENVQWSDYIYPILLTSNNKNKHGSTGETPAVASKPDKQTEVKDSLEKKARMNRVYPELKVGDMVKIYTKRQRGDKERIPLFSSNRYEIQSIREKLGLKIYKANNKEYMRNEIMKLLGQFY
jgi:hypothetical protein